MLIILSNGSALTVVKSTRQLKKKTTSEYEKFNIALLEES